MPLLAKVDEGDQARKIVVIEAKIRVRIVPLLQAELDEGDQARKIVIEAKIHVGSLDLEDRKAGLR